MLLIGQKEPEQPTGTAKPRPLHERQLGLVLRPVCHTAAQSDADWLIFRKSRFFFSERLELSHLSKDSNRFYWIQILPDPTRFYRIQQDSTGSDRILPDPAAFYRIRQDPTGFYWILPDPTGFYRILQDSTRSDRILPDSTGSYHILADSTGSDQILLDSTRFYWILPDSNGFYWIFLKLDNNRLKEPNVLTEPLESDQKLEPHLFSINFICNILEFYWNPFQEF